MVEMKNVDFKCVFKQWKMKTNSAFADEVKINDDTCGFDSVVTVVDSIV